jgi:hypothetical protein
VSSRAGLDDVESSNSDPSVVQPVAGRYPGSFGLHDAEEIKISCACEESKTVSTINHTVIKIPKLWGALPSGTSLVLLFVCKAKKYFQIVLAWMRYSCCHKALHNSNSYSIGSFR